MSKPFGRNFKITMDDGTGKFVPIAPIYVPKATEEIPCYQAQPKRTRIVCVPTPCAEGFHYVPDWWGITEFG